ALWPVVGIAVPMVLLGLFGLLLPTIDSKLAAGQGVLAVISAHATAWVTVPFFLFIVVGEIWANYLDVYTAGLVTLAMGIRLQRWQTALGCGLLGTALATYAVLVTDFHVAYEDFLILTYLWAPAWAAVVLLSFFVFEGRGRPGARLRGRGRPPRRPPNLRGPGGARHLGPGRGHRPEPGGRGRHPRASRVVGPRADRRGRRGPGCGRRQDRHAVERGDHRG